MHPVSSGLRPLWPLYGPGAGQHLLIRQFYGSAGPPRPAYGTLRPSAFPVPWPRFGGAFFVTLTVSSFVTNSLKYDPEHFFGSPRFSLAAPPELSEARRLQGEDHDHQNQTSRSDLGRWRRDRRRDEFRRSGAFSRRRRVSWRRGPWRRMSWRRGSRRRLPRRGISWRRVSPRIRRLSRLRRIPRFPNGWRARFPRRLRACLPRRRLSQRDGGPPLGRPSLRWTVRQRLGGSRPWAALWLCVGSRQSLARRPKRRPLRLMGRLWRVQRIWRRRLLHRL